MNLTLVWHLAIRYLRGKRTANIVPILSRISMVAIAVCSGAMIVVFSVFNGFEGLVKDLYKAFYPELKVVPAKGKFFSLTPSVLNSIKQIKGIHLLSYVIEDQVLINSGDEQRPVTLKGIDSNYLKVNDVRSYIIRGRDSITEYPVPTALVGQQIADQMGLDVDNAFIKMTLYYPNAHNPNPSLDPASAFQQLILKPDGVFHILDEFDSKYILAPLPLVQDLFLEGGKYSSIEIKLDKSANAGVVQKELQHVIGTNSIVQTRFEQNKTLYMVMRTEKWAVYAILLLVLLIASFNMIGALSLLVVEKQKDIAILKAMGAQRLTIRRIFMLEGALWSIIGGIAGLLAGALLCMGQQHFKWIKIGGSFVIEAYPVQMQLMDFVQVIATIVLIGLLASWYPAARATRAEIFDLKTS